MLMPAGLLCRQTSDTLTFTTPAQHTHADGEHEQGAAHVGGNRHPHAGAPGDGGSDDGTVAIIKEYEPKFGGRMRWLSELDKGMYDAINKGIRMATGDVVGILNADDVLADDSTLKGIAECFSHKERKGGEEKVEGANNSQLLTHNSQLCIDCVYADIRFVKGGNTVEELCGANTVRYCWAARWRPWMFP